MGGDAQTIRRKRLEIYQLGDGEALAAAFARYPKPMDMARRKSSLGGTLMKTRQASLLRSMVTLPAIAILTLNAAAAEEPRFNALAEDYAAKAKIVEEMDRIVLANVKIEKRTLVEAVDEIRKKGAGNKWATVSFVIRKPRVNAVVEPSAGDPFAWSNDAGVKTDDAEARNEAKQPEITERISLSAEKISFAGAIDEICKQTGHRWWIELVGAGMPLLVIGPHEGSDGSGK